MMMVELSFAVPATAERLAGRGAHRERLARLKEEGRLWAAGPWEDDSGAVLVFHVKRAELEQLLAEDPYYRLPGVTLVAARDWRPVVGC